MAQDDPGGISVSYLAVVPCRMRISLRLTLRRYRAEHVYKSTWLLPDQVKKSQISIESRENICINPLKSVYIKPKKEGVAQSRAELGAIMKPNWFYNIKQQRNCLLYSS